jgi:hypothetical protein
MVLIVNDRAGTWKRVYGLGSIAVLMRSVQQMLPASVGTAPQADGTVPMERTKN